MFDNIMTLTDGYKPSHWKMYPPNTTAIYSYLESRGGQFDNTVFFGLQYIIQRYLEGRVVTPAKIKQAAARVKNLIGRDDVFNIEGWEHVLHAHDGKLPIRIMAYKEGTSVPTHTPLMTVMNTCSKCYWLTNYVETLLVEVWYPTTVATISRECKKIILEHLETSGTPEEIFWKLHDFGFRGVSSVESAAIGGAAHLVNFRGTDTMVALEMIEEFYDDAEKVADSVPASEHSTITAWGRDRELEAYRNVLRAYPDGMVACVSDSYDMGNAVSNMWGGSLRSMVLKRNGRLIIRPDSGDPVASVLDTVNRLFEKFGGSTNDKGYFLLDPHVRVIQGDGVDPDSIGGVLDALEEHLFSADNVSFGMGGALLQKMNRDTQKFAMKCSWAEVAGLGQDVYKVPVGDPTKASKAGRFTNPKLEMVFQDGDMYNRQSFSAIRDRARL